LAAWKGHTETVALLFEKGAKIDPKTVFCAAFTT
jgi:hypothetical protein